MKSKYQNVYWAKTSSKWMARVVLGKQQHHLGVFENEDDANKAVIEFKLANNIHTEFQKLPPIIDSFTYCDGILYSRFHTSKYKAGDSVGCVGPSGYVEVGHNGKLHRAHRVIWEMFNGKIPFGMLIDHINGIRSDNRIENLRTVTNAENSRNSRLRRKSRTGIHGVNERTDGKYQAHIGSGHGRLEYLGYYSDFFDACCARKSAELRFGFHENHGRKF
jgi:hypothetical protein